MPKSQSLGYHPNQALPTGPAQGLPKSHCPKVDEVSCTLVTNKKLKQVSSWPSGLQQKSPETVNKSKNTSSPRTLATAEMTSQPFTTQPTMHQHTFLVPFNGAERKCPICQSSFQSHNNTVRHLLWAHNNMNNIFRCHCSKEWSQLKQAHLHLKKHPSSKGLG